MKNGSAPECLSTTQRKIRYITLAVIVGVLIFNWWSERDRRDPADPVGGVSQERPISDKFALDTIASSSVVDDEGGPKDSSPATLTPKPDQSRVSDAPNVQTSNLTVRTSTDSITPPARAPPAVNSKKQTTNHESSGLPSKPKTQSIKPGEPRVDGLKVHDLVIRNLNDVVVYRGTVDLAKTLARIDDERVLTEFRHDGIEFKNFERRLPIKSRGHYREWVHPTSGQSGPGPQRVVTGKGGEAFYTWDHYEHFVRIRSGR